MTRWQYAVQLVAGLALVSAAVHLVHGIVTLPEYPPPRDLDAGGRFALSFVVLALAGGALVALGVSLWRGIGAVALIVMGAAGVVVPVSMFDPAPNAPLVGLRDYVVQASALSGLACLLATAATVAWFTRSRRPARPRPSGSSG
jgi:hypothetical protein